MVVFPRNISEDIETLTVSSSAFNDHTIIPIRYTCDGENINPPITIQNIPEGTKSMVLIVEDPDAPVRSWVHWIVWDIPPTTKVKEKLMSVLGVVGTNDFGKKKYIGPCPPSGVHRYFFKVYALNDVLKLKPTAKKVELEKEMSSHIIGFGELVGLYKRINNN
jgi:Raf kinase inhibitor-like YbhB/YbcL family protein